MNRMDKKICVVTGATQGLGAAIARRLAAAGAAGIAVTGRNGERGNTLANGMSEEFGVPTVFIRADLESVDDCYRVITETDQRFGRLNVLVNSGASTERGTILDTDPALFDRIFATNLRGPYFLMQEAIKLMIRDGTEDAICNIGSISALSGQPFINAYCASKGALTTLTANTAFSVAGNRIRINQLNVGWMASDQEQKNQAADDPDWLEKAAKQLPFGRLVDPAEAARAVNFLVSDDAGLMTGSIVNFDQSVWGAAASGMPAPDGPMKFLPDHHCTTRRADRETWRRLPMLLQARAPRCKLGRPTSAFVTFTGGRDSRNPTRRSGERGGVPGARPAGCSAPNSGRQGAPGPLTRHTFSSAGSSGLQVFNLAYL
jgi:NAD(P)-dependent dehydrogenase (short-subunit alcohol dehydrogenase family)